MRAKRASAGMLMYRLTMQQLRHVDHTENANGRNRKVLLGPWHHRVEKPLRMDSRLVRKAQAGAWKFYLMDFM